VHVFFEFFGRIDEFLDFKLLGTLLHKKAIFDFFSGAVIPLQLLPLSTQKIVGILPFKNIVFIPTLIYLGKFTIYKSILRILLGYHVVAFS